MTKKQKMIAAVVATLTMAVFGMAGALVEESSAQQQKTAPAAAKPSLTACTEKQGQKVPSRSLSLCKVVQAQDAYETAETGAPQGTVLVRECRSAARLESIEGGAAKLGASYLTTCLVNEHAMWWKAQPKK